MSEKTNTIRYHHLSMLEKTLRRYPKRLPKLKPLKSSDTFFVTATVTFCKQALWAKSRRLKKRAFFLEHIALLKPGGLLDLNAIYENLLTQGAQKEEIKSALTFFKSKEHRFDTHMQLPVALENTNRETLAAILKDTTGQMDGPIRQSKATENALKTPRPRLDPSKAPKAYTQDVVPGSKDYLRNLG